MNGADLRGPFSRSAVTRHATETRIHLTITLRAHRLQLMLDS